MKQCTGCKKQKPRAEFYARMSSGDGLQARCKICISVDQRRRRVSNGDNIRATARACHALNPDKARAEGLKSKFGVTLANYQEMFDHQNGLCAVCEQPETTMLGGKIKWLAVDHDHECCPSRKSCGKCVRRLLCGKCNVGLGNFNDNPALLRAAALYLEMRQAIARCS